jgi:hypothetical protein
MPDSKVVDAWALLAWIRDEQPAANHVRDCLQQAGDGALQLSMSWIKAGEVYYMLARKHAVKVAEDFLTRLPSLPIRLVLPDEEDVIESARLKSLFRLSLCRCIRRRSRHQRECRHHHGRPGVARNGAQRAKSRMDRPFLRL